MQMINKNKAKKKMSNPSIQNPITMKKKNLACILNIQTFLEKARSGKNPKDLTFQNNPQVPRKIFLFKEKKNLQAKKMKSSVKTKNNRKRKNSYS